MNNSKKYQYKIIEISFDQSKLNNFANERGVGHYLEQNKVNEEITHLREKLLDELFEIINSKSLTDHQRKILMMRLMGKTQNEIATHLGRTQSAVHKALHGNIDYKNQKKRYGGIIKKLKKICKTNKNIETLLKQIDEIKNKDKQD